MVLADDPRRELRDDHLADPIVDHLDGLDPVADARAHEAPRAYEADRVVDRVADARGVGRDRDGQRTTRHRHDAEQPQLPLREPLEARLDHLRERDRRDPRRRVLRARHAVGTGHAARELVDQEGAAARLEGDRVRGDPGPAVVGPEQGQREPARLVLRERTDRDRP